MFQRNISDMVVYLIVSNYGIRLLYSIIVFNCCIQFTDHGCNVWWWVRSLTAHWAHYGATVDKLPLHRAMAGSRLNLKICPSLASTSAATLKNNYNISNLPHLTLGCARGNRCQASGRWSKAAKRNWNETRVRTRQPLDVENLPGLRHYFCCNTLKNKLFATSPIFQ